MTESANTAYIKFCFSSLHRFLSGGFYKLELFVVITEKYDDYI